MNTQQSTQASQGGSGVVNGPTTYTISGVKVEFPTKAYPSQLAMMNKVIQGLKQRKNCLLESPTGSGKTLALLCAALAWQRHEAARVAEFNAEIDARNEALQRQQTQQQRKSTQQKGTQPQQASCGGETSTSGNEKGQAVSEIEMVDLSGGSDPDALNPEVSSYFSGRDMSELLTDDEDDDDFKPMKRTKSLVMNESRGLSISNNRKVFKVPIKETPVPVVNEPKTEKPYFIPPEKKLVVPKIFFGTRTHRQISQITRELRKTFYKGVRSVILASREHTCINPMVEGKPNKNEACRELLDSASMGGGCGWHMAAKKFSSFAALAHYGVLPGYDLEDLVTASREAKVCPYYATRFLMTNADIIFCPYNYMIDPNIRRSMSIELENQVLIFDEAHNMEDAAREAASFTMKQNELQKAMQDCEKIKNIGGAEPHALGEMASLLSSMSVWIDSHSANLKEVSYNSSGKFWTGTEVIASLHGGGLTEERLQMCERYFKAIMAQKDKDMELMKERGGRYQLDKHEISPLTISILENVFRLFQEMHKDHGRHRDDFRIALVKSTERRREFGRGPLQSVVVFTLNVWCLNPAVAFFEIKEAVHSIVLTSGTLSPMNSFESELGTPFPFRLEASHVIDTNQVWAGVLGTGPSRVSLNGSYRNTESLAYQDEIGSIIQEVCNVMPYGILCFLPSYRMLDKLIERWRITGRYQKLEQKKQIVVEPRTGAADFESAMHEFYNAVKSCEKDGTSSGMTGALFFAVCRGKVSEGLDFSDNNARAVICIGIPFPNFQDMQVSLKREYNQQNMSRGLLSGGDWYEIQAFRALNQALGRCIRHRQDWGAILLIDERYIQTPRYLGSLSRWIRSSVMTFQSFDNIPHSLRSFRDGMLSRPVVTETPFGTERNALVSNAMGKRQGGTELENVGHGAVLQFGMSSGEFGTSHRKEPLVSFANGFSGCNSHSLDNSTPHVHSNAQLSFDCGSNYQINSPINAFNGGNTTTPHRIFARSNNNNESLVQGSGIAAMFARQRQKAQTSIFLSDSSPPDSGISSISEPTRNNNNNKRARERKIKL